MTVHPVENPVLEVLFFYFPVFIMNDILTYVFIVVY